LAKKNEKKKKNPNDDSEKKDDALCIVADATALYIQPAAQWAVPGARFWGVGGGECSLAI